MLDWEKYVPKSFSHTGEYAIDEMQIRHIDKNWIQISYEQYIINSPRWVVNIQLNFIDRWKGISLDQKFKRVYAELLNKLKSENDQIALRRENEKRLKEYARNIQ